ncbi:MAG TPA: HAMP domain-containing histidine kinase [Clostridiaceae bacterium]|nr:HAMP domain-containing histidine kinase [Clostridiaceae bacterium]
MNTAAIVLLTAILTTAICMVAVFIWNRYHGSKRNKRVMKVIEQVRAERIESQRILAVLELGILAYGSDEHLLTANRMARFMLKEIPEVFLEFCQKYGSENGIHASVLLGNNNVNGIYTAGDRFYRITIQKQRLGSSGNRRYGHIVMVLDITAQENEEKRRKEFVANVSHELKTPLTTIKSWSESLLDWGIDEKDSTGIKADVQRIYDDSMRMDQLVSDLLLLSSIDSRGVYVDFQPIDLDSIARSVTERLIPQAEDQDQKLSFTRLGKIPMIYGDRAAIERILTNLIVNAIKYTHDGGQISVYANSLIDEVYVKVADNGKGIRQEFQEEIFKRFFRLDPTGSRQYGGTGLGLPIVRELTNLHRGRIELQSEIGEGCEFMVFIPTLNKVRRDILFDLIAGNIIDDPCGQAAEREIRTFLTRNGDIDWPPRLTGNDCEIILKKMDENMNPG